MNDSSNTLADIPTNLQMRMVKSGPLIIAGLCEPLTASSHETIPLLWQQLSKRSVEIPNRINAAGYGLCLKNNSAGFYYMAGYAVWDCTELPPGIHHSVLPPLDYGVFTHSGHVAQIPDTIDAVFDQWLPNSGYQLNSSPNNPLHFFEYYGENFNPATGMGGIEIWLPIKPLT